MERKPGQKLPFATSIAVFRDVNIEIKLQLVHCSLHAVIDQIDLKHLVYEKLRPSERNTLVSPLQI